MRVEILHVADRARGLFFDDKARAPTPQIPHEQRQAFRLQFLASDQANLFVENGVGDLPSHPLPGGLRQDDVNQGGHGTKAPEYFASLRGTDELRPKILPRSEDQTSRSFFYVSL